MEPKIPAERGDMRKDGGYDLFDDSFGSRFDDGFGSRFDDSFDDSICVSTRRKGMSRVREIMRAVNGSPWNPVTFLWDLVRYPIETVEIFVILALKMIGAALRWMTVPMRKELKWSTDKLNALEAEWHAAKCVMDVKAIRRTGKAVKAAKDRNKGLLWWQDTGDYLHEMFYGMGSSLWFHSIDIETNPRWESGRIIEFGFNLGRRMVMTHSTVLEKDPDWPSIMIDCTMTKLDKAAVKAALWLHGLFSSMLNGIDYLTGSRM